MSPHPVAVAPDVNDVAVVQDPVDQRGRLGLCLKMISGKEYSR